MSLMKPWSTPSASLNRPRRDARTLGLTSPSGTVTFLFTDVEGSTKLLHELGARLRRGACRAPARDPCGMRDRGGVEVDTQGDAFFFAFPRHRERSRPPRRSPGARIRPDRVRVGLHTGTPLLTDEGYIGDRVHFGARVAASGHGGQVILSAATAEARRARARRPRRAPAARTSPRPCPSTSSATGRSRR